MFAAVITAGLGFASLLTVQESNTPAAPRSTERALQLEVREYFSSRGKEPAYWASYARSDFERRPDDAGVVDFTFALKEIATVLGAEPEVQFAVEAGSDTLKISQDPATQLLNMAGQSPVIDYINAATATLQPRSGRWVERIVPFDNTVVPGAKGGDLPIVCASEPLVIGGITYTLLTYRTDQHRFQLEDASVVMAYRGMAIVDANTGLAYHAIYEQQGKVTSAAGESDVSQRSALTLIDASQGGVIALDLPQRVRDQVNSYLFLAREDLEPLDPSIYDNNVRPEWSVDLWLAGRIAEARMGLAVEQATNPLPAAVIGGLVMTDQAISFGASKLLQSRLVARGELGLDEQWTQRVKSPIEKAYGPAGEQLVDRLNILGPETTGVLKVENEEAVAVGLLLLLGVDHFGADDVGRRLKFATSNTTAAAAAGTPAWFVVTGAETAPLVAVAGGGAAAAAGGVGAAGGSGIGAGGWLLLGGAVAAGVEQSSGGSGGAGQNPGGGQTPFTELQLTESFSQGCSSGQFQLRILDEVPGRTWVIQGSGTITGGVTCQIGSTNWSETAQGTTSSGSVLTLTISLPNHLCIGGTVTITANGAPAAFMYRGSTFQGMVNNTCF